MNNNNQVLNKLQKDLSEAEEYKRKMKKKGNDDVVYRMNVKIAHIKASIDELK